MTSFLFVHVICEQDQFSRDLGASFMLDHFKVMCIPSPEIIVALLSMVSFVLVRFYRCILLVYFILECYLFFCTRFCCCGSRVRVCS